jgi:hypothetical protein
MMEPNLHLLSLDLVDPAPQWEALGFTVADDAIVLDSVTIRVGAATPALGVAGIGGRADLDGVTLRSPEPPQKTLVPHPNGVTGIDHFVIVSPDFDRTAASLQAAAMPLRRVRDAGGFRQGFRRLGPAILELVEAVQMADGPARFWGLTLIASDLDALAARLGDRLRPIKDAVQPGRRIATLDRVAGLRTNVAFMSPE